MYSSGAEGLAMALNVFDKLESKREKVQEVSLETSRFVIYIANSAPYELPVEFVPKYVGLKTEEVLKKFVELKIKMSIFSPRKIPVLFRLFREAGGDISKYKEKNYARDPKHLVILNGFELQSVPIIHTPNPPPIPAPSPDLPRPNSTTQPHPINVPIQSPSQPVNTKIGTNAGTTIVSQNNTIVQQPLVSAGNVASTASQIVTGSPGSGMVSGQPNTLPSVANTNLQGAPRPMQQNPRMPNVNTATPRGPRPTQPPWSNQANANSPSEILRKQLTNQGGKGLPNAAAQKQAQLAKSQAAKPQMTSQGGKQSPQAQMKQGQKPMPGKSLPSPQQKANDGNKVEPDSSLGISSTTMSPMQMQIGAQGSSGINSVAGINANQQNQPTLVKLLNQGPIIRQTPPRHQLQQRPQMSMQNVANPNRPTIAQGPGGQTMMRPQAPLVQNQPAPLPVAQASAMDPQGNQGIESRKVIWTGELQWKENSKLEPNSNKKMEHTVVCSVTSKKDDNGMPEVKPDHWPPKLIMQLIPKTLVQKLGGHFFNHSRSVLFHPQKSESLDILTRVLGTGYAGCVVSLHIFEYYFSTNLNV